MPDRVRTQSKRQEEEDVDEGGDMGRVRERGCETEIRLRNEKGPKERKNGNGF